MRKLSIDATVPLLLPPIRRAGGWRLSFERARRSCAGMRALIHSMNAITWPRFLGDRMIVPVRTGTIVWQDDCLELDDEMPATLQLSLQGRDAAHVTTHPACAGRTVRAVIIQTPSAPRISGPRLHKGRTVIMLDEHRVGLDALGGGPVFGFLLPMYVAIDKATDMVTWLRLHIMSRCRDDVAVNGETMIMPPWINQSNRGASQEMP